MTGRTNSTTLSTRLRDMAGAIAMPTASNESRAAFADLAWLISQVPDEDAKHRMFDQLSNIVLCNSGLSEGVDVFCASVREYHSPETDRAITLADKETDR